MQLKVGELARSTGLTVRTLHHYDEIGLLKPSGRSDSGYRLYSQQDVARLHGIQALRHLGLPLADIASLIDGQAARPELVIDQQMKALEREIAQATELRDRLALIRQDLDKGEQPDVGDWLQALALMATYGKYFTASELKSIFGNWHRIEDEWPVLMAEVRAAMDRGVAPESAEAMSLARRWMALVHHWMGGDFDLMTRWGDMYAREPSAHGQRGGPPADMLAYMQQIAQARMAILQRYFTIDEMRRFRHVPEREWRAVNAEAEAMIRVATRPGDPKAVALARHWHALVRSLVGGDAGLHAKLVAMGQQEPLLRESAPVTAEVRAFLMQALDPHAT